VNELYQELDLPFEGRWFGLVQALAREDGRGVVDLATELGLSHTAVAHLLRELESAGWAERHADPADARRQLVLLTRAGRQRLKRLEPVWKAVRDTTALLLSEEAPELLARLEALEVSLDRRPLADRMLKELGRDPRQRLRVVRYRPAYRRLFMDLNLAWLHEHFQPEEKDLRLLADPAGRVLRRGGLILVALWQERPVGVCALIRHGAGDIELAKMAVDPAHRRRGAGEALVHAACAAARGLGATSLWLLTHPALVDAQRLYLRLGFRVTGPDGSYKSRPSLRMERPLDLSDENR
jgi:DNA-binding MarR family transcriptional regulator/GNAT superfamily N-acetyltransferase